LLASRAIEERPSFYRFAHIDGRISSNPAQYVRRPRVHPSEARGLDRSELGMFLFTAEQYDRDHAALAVLLGLNGLRVSEACATNIEDLGSERGHRTLGILGKGTKPATIPLVPRTARTIDLAVGERFEGPVLRRRDGERLDRRTARRWVRAIGKRAGLGQVHPHMLRAAFIMAALRRSVLMGGGELTDKALERAPRMRLHSADRADLGLDHRVGIEVLIEETEAVARVEGIAGCSPRPEAVIGVGELSGSYGHRTGHIGEVAESCHCLRFGATPATA
jgi:integrase/recombinase XerD